MEEYRNTDIKGEFEAIETPDELDTGPTVESLRSNIDIVIRNLTDKSLSGDPIDMDKISDSLNLLKEQFAALKELQEK